MNEADLRHALVSARTCTAQERCKWLVSGTDLDGDELSVVVVLEDGLIVVTVF